MIDTRLSAGIALAPLLVLAVLAFPRESTVEPIAVRSIDARPDIVFVSIDSLRPDHLGCYGYSKPTSPTFDRIAKEGVRFETAVSTTSWTLPAHAAMFTGLCDSAHGATDVGRKLDDEHVTLAEILRSAGWHTAGFFGGPFLHPTFGLDQGFDVYRNCMSDAPAVVEAKAIREALREGRDPSHSVVTGPRTLGAIESWLAGVDEKKPFFLFVHLWDVHYDYIPPKEYVEMFDPGYEGTLEAIDLEENPAIVRTMPERDLEHLLALYDGEIRFTDDVLEKILAALDKKGRLDNTLIVLTADHGQEFFEHGGKGHQKTLYDEVVRVPLVIRLPGKIEAGRVVEDQVRLIDLLPTITRLAGVEKLPIVQGRDLGPLLRGSTLAPAPAFSELLVGQVDLRALRTLKTKVIDSRRLRLTHGFDLDADPGELHPLLTSETWVRTERDAIAKELEAARAAGARIGAEATDAEVDAEMKKRLDRLGYTGADEPDPADEPR
jgi:arylsulfatase A-like enzyme